jgi:hypothetical protein
VVQSVGHITFNPMHGFAGAAEQRAGTHISKAPTNSAVETGLHCQARFDAVHHTTTITMRPVRLGQWWPAIDDAASSKSKDVT